MFNMKKLNYEKIRIIKIAFLTVFAVCIMSLSSVLAVNYNCQAKVQTGCGYSQSKCQGQFLVCVGYYDSSSEKYFVMNHVNGPTSKLSKSDGCYAGKRNASVSIPLKDDGYTSYKGCKHTHSYTKNLI